MMESPKPQNEAVNESITKDEVRELVDAVLLDGDDHLRTPEAIEHMYRSLNNYISEKDIQKGTPEGDTQINEFLLSILSAKDNAHVPLKEYTVGSDGVVEFKG